MKVENLKYSEKLPSKSLALLDLSKEKGANHIKSL